MRETEGRASAKALRQKCAKEHRGGRGGYRGAGEETTERVSTDCRALQAVEEKVVETFRSKGEENLEAE